MDGEWEKVYPLSTQNKGKLREVRRKKPTANGRRHVKKFANIAGASLWSGRRDKWSVRGCVRRFKPAYRSLREDKFRDRSENFW